MIASYSLDGIPVDPEVVKRALRARERIATRRSDRLWYADPTGNTAVRNLEDRRTQQDGSGRPDLRTIVASVLP